MTTTTQTEAETLRELIDELEPIADDPLAGAEDVQHATDLLANAHARLRVLQDQEAGYLEPGEDRIVQDGKSYVVNQYQHGEPDIANPDPLAVPGDKVLTPTEVGASYTGNLLVRLFTRLDNIEDIITTILGRLSNLESPTRGRTK